MAVDYFMLA